jgi:DNA helicase II / ATP-dependent DNA helicase PcrA
MNQMKLTEEQENILSLANDSTNLQIVAYAGTGKTSTLELLANACETKPKLCLAFNKRIAEEMVKRMPSTTECRTLNSLGHKVWANTIPKRCAINTKKTLELFREVMRALPKNIQRELWDEYYEISTAVNMAKALGYIPERVMPQAIRLINRNDFYSSLEDRLSLQGAEITDQILTLSIRTAYEGNLDFNDQLYMPALFGGTFPKFPVVMVDEYQDLSPVNHMMIAKLAKHSRLIAVGDPYQSIYAFRGAKQRGMEDARIQFEMLQRPLSISFRCPSEIVKNARWRAPDFKWLNFGGMVTWLETLQSGDIQDGAAVICRNNAPLFRMALQLISAGRSVSVAGTDIGPKLINILRKLGDEGMARSSILSAIAEWQDRRAETSNTAADMADCMRVLAQDNLGQTIAYAEWLFRQDGSIHLSTGHKSKGLEWATVYHLDPWLIKDGEQEMNLRYVIQTRASEAYFEVDSREVSYA